MTLLLLLALYAETLFDRAQKPPVEFSGWVTRVKDGDTVVIQLNREFESYRLARIDAPELAQNHGTDAQAAARRLLEGDFAQSQNTRRERYGRLLGDLYVDGRCVATELVRGGHAWVYLSKDAALLAAQRDAQEARRGLWAWPRPVAPWVYRAHKSGPKLQR